MTSSAGQELDGASLPALRVRVAASGALFLLTLAVFWGTGTHEFIFYDDPAYVVDNPQVNQGLRLAAALQSLSSTDQGNWHPLTWISHMLDCQLFGLEPAGHHRMSAALHALNAALLLGLLIALSRAFWPSVLIALLFALHPVNVEPVAWVAQRKHVLSSLFWFLSMGAYAGYARRGGRARYLLSLGLFAIGLSAKAQLVTLPCVLLLLDLWPLERLRRSTLRALLLEKVPFFVLSAAVVVILLVAQRAPRPPAYLNSVDQAAIPLGARLLNVPVHYALHLSKLAFPWDLAALYGHPGSFSFAARAGALALLVALSVLAVWSARRARFVLVGWLWFLGTLVPVIGLVQTGRSAAADRYAYVSGLGIFLMLAGALSAATRRWPKARAPIVVVVVIALGGMCVRTVQQIDTWRDSMTLFGHASRVTHGNAQAHRFYAAALADARRDGEAAAAFEEAVRIRPRHAETHCELALVRLRQGRLRESLRHFNTSLEIMPLSARALTGLGQAQLEIGMGRDAVRSLEHAVELDPESLPARLSLGLALEQAGNADEARRHLREAVRLDPDDERARAALERLGAP